MGWNSLTNDVGSTHKTIGFPLIFANHKFHNSIVLILNERFLQTHSNLDDLEFHLPTLPPSLPPLIITTCLVPLHKRSHLLPSSFLCERTWEALFMWLSIWQMFYWFFFFIKHFTSFTESFMINGKIYQDWPRSYNQTNNRKYWKYFSKNILLQNKWSPSWKYFAIFKKKTFSKLLKHVSFHV